ncbi:MAG: histidine--tRNA ligase [Rectinemataceae bacterium]
MPDTIEPRVLKGFRDYLPEAELARLALTHKLERVFGSFGFVPIDTPALEYAEILLGKGGGETDKQVYRFKDNGDRDVALRFDLTVPFARFMAEHVDALYLPFRRYHMAKVWRGENTQRGRYREFMQCDFDIVGTDSAAADADIILTIAEAMRALEVGEVRIRVNHRGLFNRFLAVRGVAAKSVAVLRTVDKLEKIGAEETERLLTADIGPENARAVLEFIHPEADFSSTLEKMYSACGETDPEALAARNRLAQVRDIAEAAGAAASLVLDPSITRGLDYYTGLVVETSLADMPQIGSVCSGGRYNELASLYTTKKLPGVGASIGLDRLLAALEALNRSGDRPEVTKLLILNLEDTAQTQPQLQAQAQRAAAALRRQGIAVEVFPEAKKLQVQYAYAERKGIPFALLLDGKAVEAGKWPLRNLASRSTRDFSSLKEVADALNEPRSPDAKKSAGSGSDA